MSTKPLGYLACSYKATSVLFLQLYKCTLLLHKAYCLNHPPLDVYFISVGWMNAGRLQLGVFWFKVGSSAGNHQLFVILGASKVPRYTFLQILKVIYSQYFLSVKVGGSLNGQNEVSVVPNFIWVAVP